MALEQPGDAPDFTVEDDVGDTGWVWYSGYGAPEAYQYNSSSRYDMPVLNTVVRSATGVYRVTFPNLAASGGHVQVTAYGSSSRRCKVQSWYPSGADQIVHVRCFDDAGAPTDSAFTALYRRHGAWSTYADGNAAYLWANQPTASSYTPSLSYQYNATGGTNTITRTSTGAYAVRLPGMNATGGTVLVTAYGAGAEHCKVGGWYASSGDTHVTVYCFDSAGSPVDTRFDLSYAIDTALGGAGATYGSQEGAYAWGGGSSSYLSSLYSWIWNYFSDDEMSLTRQGTGRYRLSIKYADPAYYTTVLVTAYGQDSKHCHVSSWSSSSVYTDGTDIYVRCFDGAGSLSDSYFTLTFQGDMWPLI